MFIICYVFDIMCFVLVFKLPFQGANWLLSSFTQGVATGLN